MQKTLQPALRWFGVAAALAPVAFGFERAGLPSPYLLAAFVVGIAYALLAHVSLDVPRHAAVAAQGVVGVTAGSYLQRSTVGALGAHLVPVLVVSVLTVALSVAAGLVLARFSRVDRATAAFGMIAGGAAGIIALSRELGADERLVAVMQYVRVLIIVAVTPVVAIGVFGMTRSTHGVVTGPLVSGGGLLYVAGALAVGLWLARVLRLPGGAILGPMVAAAAVSLIYRPLVAPIPLVVADLAFAVIGLDVGLRFTRRSLREAGGMLPRSIVVIVGMLCISAALGVALAATAHVSMLDGYLATTPGGLTAILALAVGGQTNTTFIVSVQVIRTFLMLAAAPPIARWLASGS
ncbi:MAG TPA: AbrB family transcriptional regulator [Gaiellaceae bacterium]|nr:AbrB family transcriptional regulator [Gaiellaceae bacterium]